MTPDKLTVSPTKGPGGHAGNDSIASAASSHPRCQLFGSATPGPVPTLRPQRPFTAAHGPTSPGTRNSAELLDTKRHRYARLAGEAWLSATPHIN